MPGPRWVVHLGGSPGPMSLKGILERKRILGALETKMWWRDPTSLGLLEASSCQDHRTDIHWGGLGAG